MRTKTQCPVEIPEELRVILSLINSDLWHGPLYPGDHELNHRDDVPADYSFVNYCEKAADMLEEIGLLHPVIVNGNTGEIYGSEGEFEAAMWVHGYNDETGEFDGEHEFDEIGASECREYDFLREEYGQLAGYVR